MTSKLFAAIIAVLSFLVLSYLAMLATPTLITVSGTVSTPVGMSPNGTVVQIYNQNGLLVGQQIVGDTGAFRINSSSKLTGTYKVSASNGDAAGQVFMGVGYGNNNVGVIALESGIESYHMI